jgi:hypothetical protein
MAHGQGVTLGRKSGRIIDVSRGRNLSQEDNSGE